MTTSSSSSQIHTPTLDPRPPEPTARRAARPPAASAPAATAAAATAATAAGPLGPAEQSAAAAVPPGPAAVAEALQFETIPIELLREHFTRWLIETLTHAHFPADRDLTAGGDFPAVLSGTDEAASPLTEASAAALAAASPPTTIGTAAPEATSPLAEADAALLEAAAAAAPFATSEPAVTDPPGGPIAANPAPKSKRAKAANRPPTRKREGPLSDATPPPPQQPGSPQSVPTAAPIARPVARPAVDPSVSRSMAPIGSPIAPPTSARMAAPVVSPIATAAGRALAAPAGPWNAAPDVSRVAELGDAAGGGRVVESSGRPQYVRMGDRSVWLTKPMLRARGWTEAAIRDYLPGPEALKPNPRFAVSGAPMPVWRPVTVARAEADPKWRAWLERSLRRRQTTLADLADSPDLEFRTRLELADQAIRDSLAPPTLMEAFEMSRS